MGEGNTSSVRHQRGLKRKCLKEGAGRPAISGGTAAEAGARRGCSAEEAAESGRRGVSPDHVGLVLGVLGVYNCMVKRVCADMTTDGGKT